MKLRAVIVLPSYNPDEKLVEVVKNLAAAGFERVVIINDGSRDDCLKWFDAVAAIPCCTVLKHEVNQGKGRALKTAFQYILDSGNQDFCGVITVDGDNQHHIDDILAVEQAQLKNPDSLVLGVRDFDAKDVPARSSFGNKMTSGAFKLFIGLKISDTQTGLRAIPKSALADFVSLEGERFEYETNMLLATKKLSIPIREVKIKTIYIEENATSHYRPLVDSLKIVRLMFKFGATSGTCAALDIGSYWVVFHLLGSVGLGSRVFFATLISRLLSSLTNYGLNRKAVFDSKAPIGNSGAKYFALACAQMLCSYGLVYLLTAMFGSSVIMKAIVDCSLFFLSFSIQRDWVFK